VVRRMILAASPDDEAAALEQLRRVQREDFVEILEAMDGLPVTVRLLDPPLHEFLPSTHELAVKEATVGLSDEERRLYDAARAWQEANPMLGTRGSASGSSSPVSTPCRCEPSWKPPGSGWRPGAIRSWKL